MPKIEENGAEKRYVPFDDSSKSDMSSANPSVDGHANLNSDSDEEEENTDAKGKPKSKQGAFTGVFYPVLQNILGIILFMRMP